MMPYLFISHSTQDDAFVRELQRTLGDQGVSVWIDSRDLLPGGLLAPDITRAIDEAAAFAVVVSPAALQSRWVGKEIRHALKVQKKRGREKFPVIPLSLDGTKLGVLEELFGTEPTYIPVSSAAGGAEAAVHPILVAMGRRKSGDVAPSPQPAANPLEDLVLELTDLKFEEKDGVRRASAQARLIYEPATPGQPHVRSDRTLATRGPHRADRGGGAALVSGKIRDLAQRLLPGPRAQGRGEPREMGTASARRRPARRAHRQRHEGVEADRWPGRPPILRPCRCGTRSRCAATEIEAAREAATVLLGLPWELLHDGKGFLFQGAKPTRVRRRLPNTRDDLKVSGGQARRSASCSSPRARRTKPAVTSIIVPVRCPLSKRWRHSAAW